MFKGKPKLQMNNKMALCSVALVAGVWCDDCKKDISKVNIEYTTTTRLEGTKIKTDLTRSINYSHLDAVLDHPHRVMELKTIRQGGKYGSHEICIAKIVTTPEGSLSEIWTDRSAHIESDVILTAAREMEKYILRGEGNRGRKR
jgi:hypothetical protein